MRPEKPACAPPRLSEVSPMSPLKRFQCSSDRRWPSLVLSGKIVYRFLFQRLSPPGARWCDVLGFVPAGSVSSSSTLLIFQNASHLRRLLCPPVYLLGHFTSLWHVQGKNIHRCLWRWMADSVRRPASASHSTRFTDSSHAPLTV